MVIPGILTLLGIRSMHHYGRGVVLGPMILILPAAIIVLIWLIFWIWMLIDCLARDYREFGTLVTSDRSVDKILWLLLILFIPLIGAIAYHISVRRKPRPAGNSV